VDTKTTSFQYNHLGRLEYVSYPGYSGTEDYEYDAAGNVRWCSDADHSMNNVEYIYDPQGRLSEVRQLEQLTPTELWATTLYEYDRLGNLTKVTDANGNETSYTVDDFGQTHSIDSPVTATTTMTYDLAGRLAQRADARGVTEVRDYEQGGRLETATYHLGWGLDRVSFEYADGRRLTALAGSTEEIWKHDRRGLLYSYKRDDPGGEQELELRYDKDGNLIGRHRETCVWVNYAVDYAGRPVQITGTPAGNCFQQLVFASDTEYLPFGPPVTVERGPNMSESFAFDQRYLMEEHAVERSFPPATVLQRSYTYHDSGALWTAANSLSPGDTWTYSYDDLGRLETAANPATGGFFGYVYDSIGNREQKAVGVSPQEVTDYFYETNGQNNTPVLERISVVAGPTNEIQHDDAGNLKQEITGSVTRDYTYNLRNKLFRGPGDDSPGFPTFEFDADGRRVRTWLGIGHAVNDYLLPDGRPFYSELDGGWSSVYLGDRLLARFDGNGNVDHVFTHHIGFPEVVTDSTGAVLWQAEPSPFGEILEITGGSESHDPMLRYPGQWKVPVTGFELYYNGYRWYRAGWGRYTQADPLGLAGNGLVSLVQGGLGRESSEPLFVAGSVGQNKLKSGRVQAAVHGAILANKLRTANPAPSADHLYTYVNARPLRFADPLGLSPVRNCGCRAVTASGNPGAGRGSGEQIEFQIPPDCRKYGGSGIPVPGTGDPGVTDIDFVEGQKLPGNEDFPVYYLYDDCNGGFFTSLYPPGGNPRGDFEPKIGRCCDDE